MGKWVRRRRHIDDTAAVATALQVILETGRVGGRGSGVCGVCDVGDKVSNSFNVVV